MRSRRLLAVVLLALTLLAPGLAAAQTVSVGVYLPQASFASNTERSAYADALARAMSQAAGGQLTFEARAFAKRADLLSFLAAGKVDVLVTDGLFQVGRTGVILAHAVDGRGEEGPLAALYAAPDVANLMSLRGKVLSVPEVGADNARYFINAALAGEVSGQGFFAEVRPAKDAEAALGAVKAQVTPAAFAPLDHPAAAGLRLVGQGGRIPLAVVVAPQGAALSAPIKDAVTQALLGGAGKGGGIAGWRAGTGKAFAAAARAMQSAPLVERARPIVVPASAADVKPPRARLEATGQLPRPSVGQAAIVPTLPE